MKPFSYAAPRHEREVVELLGSRWGTSEILAGGTDLVGLMKKMIVTPERVINVMEVASMRGVEANSFGATIGAATNLDDILADPQLDAYSALKQAIQGINSMQMQAQSTLGGELCQRPRCWYFRNGHGLLARGGELPSMGENRYHAIFDNAGPAKFVSPSRIAPALIALEARLRIIGPGEEDETLMPVEFFYRTPLNDQQREYALEPNQLVTHVMLPAAEGVSSATYEVRHGEGADAPLAAAAARLNLVDGLVQDAKIVLGHVAPTPRVAMEAALALYGKPVTRDTARRAAELAVAGATPLSDNRYKVQLARVSVERAILKAAGQPVGGF